VHKSFHKALSVVNTVQSISHDAKYGL
jgi:hypothetical protein